MIPKIIHYCWLSNDPIPNDMQRYVEDWKYKLSGYEFVKWDFSRFDINSSLWVRQAFENKKYAFATDYIRLYAVYNYGGIYMDMDIEVLQRFDSLLNNPYMFAVEDDKTQSIEAGCFGCEKGSQFLKDALSYYDGRSFIKEDGSFDQKTLPMILKDVYDRGQYRFKLYPQNYFTCKSFLTGEIKVSGNSYAIHHFAGSWLTKEEKRNNNKRYSLIDKYGDKLGMFFYRIDRYALHPIRLMKKIKEKLGHE